MITGLSHEKVYFYPVHVVAVNLSIYFQINYMHRMTARVVFVLLLVHASPRVCVLSTMRVFSVVLTVSIAQVVRNILSEEAPGS